jgi:hypothetical protein
MSTRLDPDYAEAIVVIVEGDALDQTGQDFLG